MQDYQLTRKEWHDKTVESLRDSNQQLKELGYSGSTSPDMSRHFWCVKNAVEKDKIVPKKVLGDYLDLLEKYVEIRKAWDLPIWQAPETSEG